MRLFVSAFFVFSLAAQVRPVRLAELPEELREEKWLSAIETATEKRLRDGEWDHLIYYALQSARFTKLPPVEPALAAKEWKETGKIPAAAAERLRAFAAAEPVEERHRVFRSMLTAEANLEAEFARTMAFLYEKEWVSRSRGGQARRDYVASLYQTRGHSSDTDPRAMFGVHVGLSVLREMSPGFRVRRVLLIGPGLDRAPRTRLQEDAPIQSYQPYALADSLLRLGLAAPGDLTVDCADVNPSVVEHIRRFPASNRMLWLRFPRGDDEWNGYFAGLGKAIGAVTEDRGLQRVEVRADAARRIRAFEMNVLTGRVEAAASYDLAVATNVLVYFRDREVGLAMANIAHALAPGGYFLHNDIRPSVERWAAVAEMPAVHARMVRSDPVAEQYDAVVLQRREGVESK